MLTSLLGGRLMAEKYGSGAPVLALHGWGRSRHDFAPILTGFDGLALDLPGFGATPLPPSPWSTAEYADAMAEAIGELPPAVVVGHSFGGRVALQLAAGHPERVAALVLTGVPLLRAELPGGRRPKPALSLRLAKRLRSWGTVPESVVDRLRERHGSPDYRAAQGDLRTILVKAVNEDYTDQLRLVGQAGLPVTLVWGAHDDAAPLAMAQQAARLLGPSARLVVCESSSHLLDADLTAALRAAVATHLE